MTCNLICFLGGIAAAAVTKLVVDSPKTRQYVVKGIAAGMKLTNEAREALQNAKEATADLCAEAKASLEAEAAAAPAPEAAPEAPAALPSPADKA